MSQTGGFFDFKGVQTGYHFGKKELIGVIIAVGLFALISVLPLEGLKETGRTTLAILVMVLALWMNPGVPQTLSSFLLVILTVGLGIMNLGDFLGGMGQSPMFMVVALLVVSMGMTNTQLAQRLSYLLITKLGTSPSRLVLALLLATTLVSMVIADIPALVMMMYISAGILTEMGEEPGKSRLGKALMFAITFGSIIGGLAFISGSGINPVGISILEQATKGKMTINFGQWAAIGVPFVALMMLPTWLILRFLFKLDKPNPNAQQLNLNIFLKKYQDLGPITNAEKRFMTTLLIMMGLFIASIWTKFPVPYVAFIALVLSIVPVWGTVNWKEAQKKIPWDLVFLIGVGTAFAKAISTTGLGLWIVKALMGWAVGLPVLTLIMIAGTVGVLSHLIIITSPSAVAVLVAAVVPLAIAAGINPAVLVMPVIFTGSAALVMPLAPDMQLTYPFGYWKLQEMFVPGFLVGAVWVIIAGLCTYFIAPFVGLM